MVNMIKFETKKEKLNHLASLTNIPSINPRDYDENSEYNRLDFIRHPQHGCGFVEEILNDSSVLAFFEVGEITLNQKAYLRRS